MSEQGKNGEYHRADPAWRRNTQLFLAATVLGGVGALAGLYLWLSRTLGSDQDANQLALSHMLALLCIALAIVALGFALWLFRVAAATRADRRWPPSSMRTSTDVKIRYLTSADAMVMQMKAGALALAIVALALLAWGLWFLRWA